MENPSYTGYNNIDTLALFIYFILAPRLFLILILLIILQLDELEIRLNLIVILLNVTA